MGQKGKDLFLYSYQLKDMPSSKKVRFVYLMKGRKDEAGFVDSLGGEYISSSVFMIPKVKDEEIMEVLAMWGVSYKKRRIVLID